MGESIRHQLERIAAERTEAMRQEVPPRRPPTKPRLESRPQTLIEAKRMQAELAAKIHDLNGQLKTRTRFEFASDDAFYDWQRTAQAMRSKTQGELALLKPIVHELQCESDRLRHETWVAMGSPPDVSVPRLDGASSSEETKLLLEENAKLRAERDELSAATVANRHAVEFLEVARVVLGEQTFNRIFARARDRVTTRKA